ncbi:M56 family metallopeptidase [Tenacibaculum amylolyticum]|uniref:M56 family metallopeptidase n=1 Tax=Tenacibaculum amylolyticum TaxID=104269 RepID=UPI0038948AF3
MISYLIKSSICLTALMLFYQFILEREKMHQFNRFYLLGSVLFSFLAPLYSISVYIPIETIVEPVIMDEPIVYTETIVQEHPINYLTVFLILSSIISFILFIRFGINLLKIFTKVRKNTNTKIDKAILVLVDDEINPHTFWNYIFINKEDYKSKNIEKELLTHELTHATQKHTLDVLFIEFLKIIFWFNPLFYILKKFIQLNHEFIADNKVIHLHKNISEYQHLLLNRTAWNNDYYLASNLNYSLTKKRLVMMSTRTSKVNNWLKKIAVIPLLTGSIYVFAERVERFQEIETINEQRNDDHDSYLEIREGESVDETSTPEHHYTKQTFWVKDKNGKQVAKKYYELSETLRKKWLLFPKNQKENITQSELNTLKNAQNYIVRINGNLINNSDLSKYRSSDFVSYSYDKIHKLAKLDQQYHYNLITVNGLKTLKNLKEIIKKEKTRTNSKQSIPSEEPIATKAKTSSKEKFLASIERTDNDAILKCYNCERWAKLKIPLNKEFTITDWGFTNNGNISKGEYAFTIKVTEKDVRFKSLKNTAWETLEFPLLENKKRYINQNGMIAYGTNLKKGIDTKLKGTNEAINNIDKLELSIPKIQKTISLQESYSDDLIFYNQQKSEYDQIRKRKPNYIYSSPERKNELDKLCSDLGLLYYALPIKDRNKTKRAARPYSPYIKIKRINDFYYKLPNELTEEDKIFIPPTIEPDASEEEKDKHRQAFRKWARKVNKYLKEKKARPVKIEVQDKPKKGMVKVNNQDLYYVTNKKGTTYYNRWGQEVDKTGKIINPEKKFPVVKKGDESNIPPPPPPKKTLKKYKDVKVIKDKKGELYMVLTDKEGKKVVKKYADLTPEEKDQLPPPPPPAPTPPKAFKKYKDVKVIKDKKGELYMVLTDKEGKKVVKKYADLTPEEKDQLPPPPPPAPAPPKAPKTRKASKAKKTGYNFKTKKKSNYRKIGKLSNKLALSLPKELIPNKVDYLNNNLVVNKVFTPKSY